MKSKLLPIFLLVVLLAALFAAPVLAQGEIPPPSYTLNALTLLTLVTGVLSLALDYFPGVASRYDALPISSKRIVALVLAIILVVGAFSLTCYGLIQTNLICTPHGVWDALANILYVFAVGQGIHIGTKPTENFKRKMLSR